MKSTRKVIMVGLMAALLCAAGAARADDKEKARALIKSGDTKYRLAKFKAALNDYSAALELRNHPAIVFNIAQCYQQLQEHKKAIFYYKLYLSDWERKKPGTKPPYEAEVNGHVASMTRLLGQKEAAKLERKRREEAERKRREEAERRRLAAQQQPAPVAPVSSSQPSDDQPARPKKSKLWLVAGVTTAAAAAGMLGLGIAYDFKSSGEIHGSDEWASAANVGLTGYILAGSFAVASGVCWFLHARSGRTPPVTAAMVPLPGGAAVGGVFSF